MIHLKQNLVTHKGDFHIYLIQLLSDTKGRLAGIWICHQMKKGQLSAHDKIRPLGSHCFF